MTFKLRKPTKLHALAYTATGVESCAIVHAIPLATFPGVQQSYHSSGMDTDQYTSAPQWKQIQTMNFCSSQNVELCHEIYQRNVSQDSTSNTFDSCLVGCPYMICHLIFTVLMFVLLYLLQWRLERTHVVRKYPGHNAQWLLSACLVFVQLIAVAEGILTSQSSSRTDNMFLEYIPSTPRSSFCHSTAALHTSLAGKILQFSVVDILDHFYWFWNS